MLSDIATATHLNRPRPPGSRRSSANKLEKVTLQEDQEHQDVNDENTTPVNLSPPKKKTLNNLMEMEKDLELDLPLDFTTALQKNSHFWPQTRKSISSSSFSSSPQRRERSFEGDTILSSRKDSKTKMTTLRDSLERPNTLQSLFHPSEENTDSEEEVEQKRILTESEAETEHSLDSQWVGDLPREELETLLMQANRVIKERERDLGIAAAIGKALLEKNISLRSKHEGIMSRLSSVNSFTPYMSTDGEASPHTLPLYSPPEIDTRMGDDETPMPTPRAHDYFEPLSDDEPAATTITSRPIQTPQMSPTKKNNGFDGPSPAYWNAGEGGQSWYSKSDCFVPSVPASPATTRCSNDVLLQFSNETQRQLETLSEQNEALLEQLAQLQVEAEQAKKDGGRRLKKLNREIDGLRNELEAATERNVELEMVAADEDHHEATSDGESSGKARRAWKRRGANWKGGQGQNKSSSPRSSSTVRANGMEAECDLTKDSATSIYSQLQEVESVADSDAGSNLAQSESSFSNATQGKILSEPERALVAQLMAKIRELEETNATLAIAGTEIDGRIGKAMEEGERIRDAYEAVENVAALEESQMKRDDSDIIETHFSGSPFSPNVSSLVHRTRRAPGNRYNIEGRRTVRAAIRREWDQDDGYYYNSDTSSFIQSPVKGQREQGRILRPKILITPSSEDLRASALEHSTNCWEDEDGEDDFQAMPVKRGSKVLQSTPIGRRRQRHRQDYPDVDKEESDFGSLRSTSSSVTFPKYGRRSLGSELGDEPLQLSDLQISESNESIRIRPSTSINSLRAASEAESDIADLRWSVNSDVTVQAIHLQIEETTPLAQITGGDETMKQIALITNQSLPLNRREDDGSWSMAPTQEVLPKGSLRNEMESTHDNYEWIESVTRKLPLHWADDDDFGRPITEKDARKLGLLVEHSLKTSKRTNLLGWLQGHGTRKDKGKMKESCYQIESREDMEEKQRLADLLREKRVVALQKRVLNGHISLEKGKEMGIIDGQVTEKTIKQIEDSSLEEEVTARALAYNTARRKKWRKSQQGRSLKETEIKDHLEGSSSDEGFEMLDLDPSKRRPGRRGTDYYPITLRDRYKPTMVKQRAKDFSTEAITWASAWATFSLVMVFAFLVTFSRGPKRVLNGQKQ